MDPMCGLTLVEDEDEVVLCPSCDKQMEEYFPEITACDVPPEENVSDASPLARAISAKFTN
jgi:uncharacterized Zn finger protein (UPF0148 family)